MKTALILACFILFTSTASFGRIVHSKDKLFLEQNGERIPIETVNQLVKDKTISKIRLYGEGKVHLISFAKKGDAEKLYSVDDKGFIYSLSPFTNYKVKDIDGEGKISFQEAPGKKYRISSKGFFFY